MEDDEDLPPIEQQQPVIEQPPRAGRQFDIERQPGSLGGFDYTPPASPRPARPPDDIPVMSLAEIQRLGGVPVEAPSRGNGIPVMSLAEIQRLGGVPYQPEAKPEASGVAGTAIRRFAHNLIPGALGVVGGTIGAGFANLPGAVAGGVGAFEAGHYLQNKAMKMFGIDDSLQMAADAEANPKTAITADIASTLPFFGVGSAPRMAVNAVRTGLQGATVATAPRAVGTALRTGFAGEAGAAALKEAGIGAGIGGALEGVNQAIEGHFDPTRLGIGIATGGVLTRSQAATKAIERSVGQMAGRATGRPDWWPAPGAPNVEATARDEDFAMPTPRRPGQFPYNPELTPADVPAPRRPDISPDDLPTPRRPGQFPYNPELTPADVPRPRRPVGGADPAQASVDGGVDLHQGQQPTVAPNVAAAGNKTPDAPGVGPENWGKAKPPPARPPVAAGEWKSDPAVDLALQAALEPKTPAGAAAAPAARPAEPPPAAAAPEGVPFMVTHKMKADLAARGFTPEQISNFTPAQAHEILRAAPPPAEAAPSAEPPAAPVDRVARSLAADEQAQRMAREGPKPVAAEPTETANPAARETLAIAKEIEATGHPQAAGFANAMRAAAQRNQVKPESIAFYRQKLADYQAQSNPAAAKPAERFSVRDILEPKQHAEFDSVVKGNGPLANALKLAVEHSEAQVRTINEAGWKVADVHGTQQQIPAAVREAKAKLSSVGGIVAATLNGLKPRIVKGQPRDVAALTAGNIKRLLEEIAGVQPAAAVPPKAQAAIDKSKAAEAAPPAVPPKAEAAIARSRGRPKKVVETREQTAARDAAQNQREMDVLRAEAVARKPAAAERAPDEVLRGPLAREVAKQHMPWYDEGYQGRPRGGNEAEQAAWDRGANDRMNAERTARGDKPAAIDAPKPKAGPNWLKTLQERTKSEPKAGAETEALQAIDRAMAPAGLAKSVEQLKETVVEPAKLTEKDVARRKELADKVIRGELPANDPELAALRDRTVTQAKVPTAAAEISQAKLDTLFANSPHKDVIPPKQRSAYDEGARDAFADRQSKSKDEQATPHLSGIYDRGYSDARKAQTAATVKEPAAEPAKHVFTYDTFPGLSPGARQANRAVVDALNGKTTNAEALQQIAKLLHAGEIPEGTANVNLNRIDISQGEINAAFAKAPAAEPAPKAAYNLSSPEGRAAKAAADAAPAEPTPARRPPADFIGKLKDDIKSTEYVNELSRLRDHKPRPVEKLWNNPDKAPPEQVAAAREDIKAWNRQYNAVRKNAALAAERDNAAYEAKQKTIGGSLSEQGAAIRDQIESRRQQAEASKTKSDAALENMKPALAGLKETIAKVAPAKEPPAKFTIAKDVETGEHVLFRNDIAKEAFTTRGAAEKARNKALMNEALAARKPAQQQQQRQAGGPETGAPPKPAAREEVTVAPSGEKPELTPSDITERIGALDPHATPAEHLAEVRYLEQQARANGMPLAEKLKSHIDAYETEVNRGEREPSGPAAESGKQYAQQTQPSTPPLEPATKSDLQQGLFASLRRQFGGALTQGSESQQVARAALRKAYGPLARLREQTATRFTNELHQLANKMDQPGFERFVDAYETGRQATLPADQQPLAKVLGKNYDDFWGAVKKHPGTDEMEATKNFLTHMYDNTSGQVDKFTGEWFGASGGSLRARKHPTFADARAAGLKPLSNNPIEHFVRYSEGISNYLAQHQMLADLTSQNRIGYFGPKVVGASGTPEPQVKGAPPEGYAEIKTPWAQKNGRQAYAPRDIAETINQFYDAGLRRSQTKDIYEFAQQTKNAWTAIELGLSAYHATTMGVESVASGMSRALQIAATGDYKRATAQLLRAPIEPVTSYLYGKQGRNIYRDATGTQGTPMQRRIIDIFTQANVQPGNRSLVGEYGAPGSNSTMREYDMSKLGNFWDAHKRGSLPNEIQAQMKSIVDSKGLTLPKVLLDNIRRATQTISKPLFEHYIPELKLGTMMKDMEAWFHANPNATDAQALKYARKISDSVDNRMGEMNYDNLFMNKTAKDIGMLSLRSFGFTVGGPIREIGAGAGRLALTAGQRQNPLKHFDLRSEAADPRTAYAMAFLPAIAAISAVYQYMRTGKGPEDWRDLVTPQTGGTVKSVGQHVPERVLVPGYHKDFLGYFVNPSGVTGELEAKLAAPWTAIKEQLTGKDWRDKPYVPPRATTLEWIQAHAKQLGSHMLPIGPKQLAEGKRQGSALTYPEQAIGVRTPGAYMLNPKGLEQFLSNQRQRDWKAKEKQDNSRRMEQGLPPNPIRPFPRAP